MNFWSFLTRPGDKHDENLGTATVPDAQDKLVQAHDSALSLTIF